MKAAQGAWRVDYQKNYFWDGNVGREGEIRRVMVEQWVPDSARSTAMQGIGWIYLSVTCLVRKEAPGDGHQTEDIQVIQGDPTAGIITEGWGQRIVGLGPEARVARELLLIQGNWDHL